MIRIQKACNINAYRIFIFYFLIYIELVILHFEKRQKNTIKKQYCLPGSGAKIVFI